MKGLAINVDFDGTVVTHEYPDIGREIGATEVLKDLVAAGHHIILFTMRSGEELAQAVQWFKDRDIPLYGVNENPTQKRWTDSPKSYAQLMIDDTAVGVPLLNGIYGARPYVDWPSIRVLLERRGVLGAPK